MDRWRVSVHIGPVRTDAADAFLERLRAYQGSIDAGSFMVGTETLYFTVGSDSRAGAMTQACTFLMAVFGAGTGLTQGIKRCERIYAGV